MINPKKILIIGGAGYVGSQLTPLTIKQWLFSWSARLIYLW